LQEIATLVEVVTRLFGTWRGLQASATPATAGSF
jgi:hypothetical protein